MAAVIPRYKNYIYGITKKNLEINIKNLDSKKTLFIRFGQVKTKMSTNHPNAPFTLSASDAAYFIFNNLHKSNIIYHSFGTRVLAILFKILPLKLINYMESKQ